MGKEYLIYYHKSPENKYYIGQTCQEVDSRWKNGHGYKTEKFSSAIKKFGWKNFEHGILEENLSKDVADQKEAYYIALFNAVDNGYNTYRENYSGYHFADLWANKDIKNKIIQKLIEQRNTPEYSEEQSKRMQQVWQREDYKKSQKEAWTDERKEKVSQWTKQNWQNKEYRDKISKAQSDYRKKDWQNPEYRKKMCVQVRCIETEQIFESVKLAAEWCGVKPNTLSSALKSKTHQSGKHPESGIRLHWERVDGVGKEE